MSEETANYMASLDVAFFIAASVALVSYAAIDVAVSKWVNKRKIK